MEVFRQMLSLQAQLFVLILLGLLLKRIRLIDRHGRKMLSSLLVNVILPCNILHAFLGDISVSPELAKNCIMAVVICAILQACVILGTPLVFRRYPRQEQSPLSYGMICCNTSFVGLPIAKALYGDIGVMYASIFNIPILITMWTAGMHLFSSTEEKGALKKTLLHPCIISVFVGIVLMFFSVKLPTVLDSTITSLGQCTLPISMLVIGAILADADVKTMFARPVMYFSLLRLVLFPLAVYALLSLLPLDTLLVRICVIISGLPAGSTTSILSEQYGCDSAFASQLVFTSTLLSMVTLPLLCLIL